MSRRIFKYPLEIHDEQVVSLPDFANPLSVQFQNGQLCLWAIVDTQIETGDWVVQIIGTGNPMPDTLGRYLGTVQELDGALVWHVFAYPKNEPF